MPQREPVRRRPWRWIAGLVLVWILVALAAVIAVSWSGARRRDAALERLRVAGEPLLPRDLVTSGVATGLEASGWLQSFPNDIVQDDTSTPMTVTALGGLVTYRLPNNPYNLPTQSTLAEIEKIPACAAVLAECGNDADVFWDRVDSALDRPVEAPAQAACWELAFRLRIEQKPSDARNAAPSSCNIPPLDPQFVFAVMERGDQPLPDDGTTASAGTAVELLCDQARAEALAGRAAQSLSALESAFCAARVISELPWIQAELTWESLVLEALNTLRQCLSLLPSEANFGALESALTELQPRPRFVRALQGQRALANRLYARRAAGRITGVRAIDDQPFLTDWIVDLFLARDQAECLARFAERIAAAQPTSQLASAATAQSERATLLIGAVLDGASHDTHVTELEARIALTQLALIARRDGVDAAQARASELLDAFDGRPLRLRKESDGTLVLWSVGPDGKDDGGNLPKSVGAGPPTDIIVTVLPRGP